jgi:hypothetical protein
VVGSKNHIFLAAGYTLRLAREIGYCQVAVVAATFLMRQYSKIIDLGKFVAVSGLKVAMKGL